MGSKAFVAAMAEVMAVMMGWKLFGTEVGMALTYCQSVISIPISPNFSFSSSSSLRCLRIFFSSVENNRSSVHASEAVMLTPKSLLITVRMAATVFLRPYRVNRDSGSH